MQIYCNFHLEDLDPDLDLRNNNFCQLQVIGPSVKTEDTCCTVGMQSEMTSVTGMPSQSHNHSFLYSGLQG